MIVVGVGAVGVVVGVAVSFLAEFGLGGAKATVGGCVCVGPFVTGSDGSTGGGGLGVSGVMDFLVALPEWFAACTRGVIVCGRRAETLLLAVMADKEDLEAGGDDEEEDVDDGNREDGCLELARASKVGQVSYILAVAEAEAVLAITGRLRVGRAATERGVDIACAGAGAATSEPCNSDIAADEADVEDDGEESKEGDASEEEGQEDGKEEVEHRSTSNALNGANPLVNGEVMVFAHGEVVGEDAEGDDAAEKLDGAKEGLGDPKDCSADGHGEGEDGMV